MHCKPQGYSLQRCWGHIRGRGGIIGLHQLAQVLHDQQEKKKRACGRAKKRIQYNRRFLNVVAGANGKREGPNKQPQGMKG